MIAGLNSSLSLAMRTADRANKTIDKMANQIATGKKVALVKDDGAAWVRSAAINSDRIRHQTVADQMHRVNAIQDVSIASMDGFLEATIKGRELVIRAIDAINNGGNRAAIQAEHAQVALSMDTIAPNAVVDGISYLAAHVYSPTVTINSIGTTAPYVWGTQPFASDSEYDDAVLQLETYAGVWPANHFSTYNLQTANLATLQTYLADYDYYVDWNRTQSQSLGIVSKNNERITERAQKRADALEVFGEKLTDADMGKASKEYEMAQTRQQLAYQTVKNAIAAYSNKANGLLSNVLNTQRSVRA